MTSPVLGLADRIRPGEEDRVELVLKSLRSLRASELRTSICAADWSTAEGRAWYVRLLPRLAAKARLLPCFAWAPASGSPLDATAYAEFVDEAIATLGGCFEHVELRESAADLVEPKADPERRKFFDSIDGAILRARQRGKRPVLGGVSLGDLEAIHPLCERGTLALVNAVGLRALCGDRASVGACTEAVRRLRQILDDGASAAEIWITEAGYSTGRQDEFNQVKTLLDFLDLPVGRVYWYSGADPDLDEAEDPCLGPEGRDWRFGLWTPSGQPKLLARLWSRDGLDGVREAGRLGSGPSRRSPRPVLITGGAGFVGTNLADRLLQEGRPVVVFDSLSRPGTEDNLRWLREKHGDAFEVVIADVRDRSALRPLVRRSSAIFHLAAQVAVTSSLTDPAHDFEVNAGGTFTLVSLVSGLADPPPLVFTSTNKVYGRLDDLRLVEDATRYVPEDPRVRARGVDEDRPLEFHSPYGCSKGAADQYVLDFARTRSLPATVFRMSCIYGPHQCGSEDQGWVCHFIRSALEGVPLTVYGNGKQVRDVLYVEDLTEAFALVMSAPEKAAGQAFNLGGGPGNALSLLELLAALRRLHGKLPPVRFSEWRSADQRYFVADAGRFRAATGWEPRVSSTEGIEKLYRWFRPRRAGFGGDSSALFRRKSS
jgi:CDP-paratose 2-epimerase